MDELEVLAAARPVDPPSARTVGDARRRLTRQIYARPTPWWRARILLPVAAGALVVSTGTVLGVQVFDPAQPSPPSVVSSPGEASGGPADRPAREMLLIAAERTLEEPDPGEGRFWTPSFEDGQLIQVGEPADRYAIMGTYAETKWIPAAGSYVVLARHWAGAEPASAADQAAWRKAGSPASWAKDPAPGCPVDPDDVYTAAAAKAGKAVKESNHPDRFRVLGEDLTADQVRALPSDPAALKQWLIGVIKKQNLPHQTDVELGESMFDGVLNLLFENPITPRVRSAAYRVLAGVPGVTSLGAVKDAEGRSGVAVAVTRNDTVAEQRADSGGSTRVSLVFDPATGKTLARETRALEPADYLAWVPKGALIDYRVLKSARWTDGEPPSTNAPAAVMRSEGEC